MPVKSSTTPVPGADVVAALRASGIEQEDPILGDVDAELAEQRQREADLPNEQVVLENLSAAELEKLKERRPDDDADEEETETTQEEINKAVESEFGTLNAPSIEEAVRVLFAQHNLAPLDITAEDKDAYAEAVALGTLYESEVPFMRNKVNVVFSALTNHHNALIYRYCEKWISDQREKYGRDLPMVEVSTRAQYARIGISLRRFVAAKNAPKEQNVPSWEPLPIIVPGKDIDEQIEALGVFIEREFGAGSKRSNHFFALLLDANRLFEGKTMTLLSKAQNDPNF
jgi:hypothetical protein